MSGMGHSHAKTRSREGELKKSCFHRLRAFVGVFSIAVTRSRICGERVLNRLLNEACFATFF